MKRSIIFLIIVLSFSSCLKEFRNKDITFELSNMTSEDLEYSIEIYKFVSKSSVKLSDSGIETLKQGMVKTTIIKGEDTQKGSSEGFYKVNLIKGDKVVRSKDFGSFDGILAGSTLYNISIEKDTIIVQR